MVAMYDRLGPQWTGTMLGCISIVMLPIPVLLFKSVIPEIVLIIDMENKFGRGRKWVGWRNKMKETFGKFWED